MQTSKRNPFNAPNEPRKSGEASRNGNLSSGAQSLVSSLDLIDQAPVMDREQMRLGALALYSVMTYGAGCAPLSIQSLYDLGFTPGDIDEIAALAKRASGRSSAQAALQ